MDRRGFFLAVNEENTPHFSGPRFSGTYLHCAQHLDVALSLPACWGVGVYMCIVIKEQNKWDRPVSFCFFLLCFLLEGDEPCR